MGERDREGMKSDLKAALSLTFLPTRVLGWQPAGGSRGQQGVHGEEGVGSHSVSGLLSRGSVDFGLCLWKTSSWDASTICPEFETLTVPLSLCPYLTLSQYGCGLCAPFSSCSLVCLCCMYLLSLSFSLLVHMSVSLPLWFHVSLSLTIFQSPFAGLRPQLLTGTLCL